MCVLLLSELILLQNLYSAQIQACSSRKRWCRWVGKSTSRGGYRLSMNHTVVRVNIHDYSRTLSLYCLLADVKAKQWPAVTNFYRLMHVHSAVHAMA